MKKKINISDINFSHSILGYCSDFQSDNRFYWDRNVTTNTDPIVYTDSTITHSNSKYKDNSYAWLLEPICVNSSIYDFIKDNNYKFKKVFTHEKSLLDLGENYELVPFGCCWIDPEDQQLHNKTKNISIISSDKKQTDGHQLRHSVIFKCQDKLDVYGRGYSPINRKITGLKDYRFSIVIENCKRDYWFTEKLIDCLTTGTIPIYWGCPSIGDFFNVNGIISFDKIEDLDDILSNCNEELYVKMLPFVNENYEKSKSYILPDSIIYNKLNNE
jgi:hypothetical protein